MAIYGAVGYRANYLSMVNGKLIVKSPMWDEFQWPESVTWARCSRGCPKDQDGHVISSESCSCGIYSTTNHNTLGYYVKGDSYVPILVESLGYYWFHVDEKDPENTGLTSAGVQVAAVIKDFTNYHTDYPKLWIEALGNYYNVPLITLEEGDALVKWAWDKFYPREELTNEHNCEEVPTAWVR